MMREAYSKWEQAHRAMYLAQGLEQGLEQGREEGREEGIAIGKEEGIAIGLERGKRAFALSLLEDGIAPERVAHHAKLPLETVLELAEKEPKTR